MKKYILIAAGIIYFGVITAQDAHRFENNNTSCTINLANGSLNKLTNKNTGWDVISNQKFAQSFTMLIDLPNGSNCVVDGKTQEKPKVEIGENQITLTWSNLRYNNNNLNISFIGKINFNDKEGLIYSGEVVNNSDAVVENLVWPYIGDVSIPKGSEKFIQQNINYGNLSATELYPKPNNYNGSCALPVNSFSLYNNTKEGLYISSKDQDLNEYISCISRIIPDDGLSQIIGGAWSMKNNGERNKMRMEISVTRMIYTQPHGDTKLADVVLTPYTGTWHVAVDIYKAWRATWFVPPHRPDWIKQVNAWQQLQINSSEDYLRFPYKDLVSYAEDCKKYGVNAIQLTGWSAGGQDRYVPSHSTDPRLGTAEDLKKAIAKCKQMGVNILLFTKFSWVDVTLDEYPAFKNFISWDQNLEEADHGGYTYNTYTQFKGISLRRFKVLCMSDDSCRAAIRKEFQKCLDLGAQGMVYDENQHQAGHWMCFNPNHSHKEPAFLFRGADLLGRDFLEMTKKQNPDFFMAGEACYDLQSKYYGIYTREDVTHTAVMRYIDPELPIACAVTANYDKNKVNSCLRCRYSISYEPRNYKGRLSEFPRIMEYGQKVDALRRKYSDFLWDGEYRDVLGATVKGKDIVYSVFKRRSDGKKAVVVLNINIKDAVDAAVSIDGSTGSQIMVSPENQEPVAFTGSVKIQPQSAVVIMEK